MIFSKHFFAYTFQVDAEAIATPRLATPVPTVGRVNGLPKVLATSATLLVVLLAVCLPAGCSRKPPPSGPPGAGAGAGGERPIVRVATPVKREVVEWAEFTGRLQAVDFVEVRSRISGYLKSVEFQEGQPIEAGDLLFVVDPRPFEAALETAKASLDEAKARAEQAEAQLATADADKLTAESNLEFAHSEFERQKSLQQRNVSTQSEFDRTRNEYTKAQAQVQSSEAAIALARAAISTAKATIVTAQAAVNEAQLNLDYTRITAPVAGRTSRRNVTEGNLISGGNDQSVVLTTIVSLDPIYMLFDASEQQVLRFQRLILQGARKSARDVKYPAYMRLEDETGFPHQGYLDFVDNRFDPVTATMTARAVFENHDGILTPGMFGKLRIAETPAFDALLVPDAAVGTDQSDQFVYVVDADGTVAMRIIETGSMALGLRIVRTGLNADDRVIVGGIQRIRPGVQVESKLETIEPDESVLGVDDATPEASE